MNITGLKRKKLGITKKIKKLSEKRDNQQKIRKLIISRDNLADKIREIKLNKNKIIK